MRPLLSRLPLTCGFRYVLSYSVAFSKFIFLTKLDMQAMVEHYVGQQVIVSVQDVNQEHNRFVGNMIEAINNDAYARLRVSVS